MRDCLQGVYGDACFIDQRAASRAFADMGSKGGHPEAHLVIEEEVDLVWKEVPVVHGVSGGSVRRVDGVGFTVWSSRVSPDIGAG